MTTHQLNPLALRSDTLRLSAVVLVALYGASASAQLPADVRCPESTVWSADELVCIGNVSCPQGSTPSGDGGACVVDTIQCREGSSLSDGACVADHIGCPTGSAPDPEGHCVAETVQCPAGATMSDGACVVDAADCPDGYVQNAETGACDVVLAWWEERRAPTCGSPVGVVNDDMPRLEATLGLALELGYVVVEADDDGGGSQGAEGIRFGAPLALGIGLTHGSLSVRVTSDLDLAGEGYKARRVALELGARCACWSDAYQWRLGMTAGYDFGAEGLVIGFGHRSQWSIWNGIVAGMEVGLVTTVGAISGGPTVGALRLGLFVGYAL